MMGLDLKEAMEVFAADPKMMTQGKSILFDLMSIKDTVENAAKKAKKLGIKTGKNLKNDLDELKKKIDFYIEYLTKATEK
jgi:uncharacterized protein YunC (DUF1805 family)